MVRLAERSWCQLGRHVSAFSLPIALTSAALSYSTPAISAEADIPHVTFHRSAGAFNGNLPTKKSFVMDIVDAEAFEEVEVVYWRNTTESGACPNVPPTDGKTLAEKRPIDAAKKTFFVPIQALARDARYCFQMTFIRGLDATEKKQLEAFVVGLAKTITTFDAATVEAATKSQFSGFTSYTTQSNEPIVNAIARLTTSPDSLTTLQTLSQDSLDFRNAVTRARSLCPNIVNGIALPTKKNGLSSKDNSKADKVLADAAPVTAARNQIPSCSDVILNSSKVDPAQPADFDDKAFLDKAGAYTTAVEGFARAHCGAAEIASMQNIFTDLSTFCTALSTSSRDATQYQTDVATAQGSGKHYEKTKADAQKKIEDDLGKIRIKDPLNAGGTVHPGFAERATLYISADVGFMIPFFAGGSQPSEKPQATVAPFVGVNFYFVPVDKDEPLKGLEIGKRLALTGGLAFNINDSAGTLKPALAVGAPFLGGGIRLTDYLRLVTGGVFVLQKNTNSLLTAEQVRFLPYIGASVDLDVVGTIKTMVTTGQSAL